MEINSYHYEGKFEGNILALGQTACGKDNFYPKPSQKQNGKIKDVTWLTKITFSKN